MENKEAKNTGTTTTSTNPLGVCERLFNALNTNNTFRPLRRLTFRQQDSDPQSETQPNNFHPTAAADAKHKIPSPPRQKIKKDAKSTDQKDDSSVTKKDMKSTGQNAIPTPVPPKGAIMPLPAPPMGAASTEATNAIPKKTFNEKAEDYIHRTKEKLRSSMTLGRTQTSK